VVLTLKTPKDKASYAIGMNIGKSIHKDAVDIDLSILVRGIKDAIGSGKTLLTDDEARAALTALQADMVKRMQQKGELFLAENKSKEGVVTLPSGLQYKILKEGTGPKPTAADTVVCNYKGTLIDNTEFDSSYKRGQSVRSGNYLFHQNLVMAHAAAPAGRSRLTRRWSSKSS
jgi:FKBP-type peptidyl-prolyl cis-trans isomerase